MRLSAPDRKEILMAAARDLFSEQGFRGTTTRQIAERAGVTEAIVFRHFASKDELYWAVLERQCKGKARLESILGLQALGDREVFVTIADDILRRHTEDKTLHRLLLFSALENHELSDR